MKFLDGRTLDQLKGIDIAKRFIFRLLLIILVWSISVLIYISFKINLILASSIFLIVSGILVIILIYRNYILKLSPLIYDIAIALGTSNVLISSKGRKVIFSEPSIVAVNKDTSKTIAVGKVAKNILDDRRIKDIIGVYPMKDETFTNYSRDLLYYLIEKSLKIKPFLKKRFVISVPTGLTKEEKQAIKEVAKSASASEVYLVEEPIAAAIGVGLPIQEPRGFMMVHIDTGLTEVAVISLNGIVCARSIRVGTDEIAQSLVSYFYNFHKLMIGEKTAEELRDRVNLVSGQREKALEEIRGRDMISGLPKTIKVSTSEIRNIISGSTNSILEAIKDTLERTPPELAEDLIENGITLTGEGAYLKGIDNLISEETGLPVHIAKEPLTSLPDGLLKAIDRKQAVFV